MCDMGENIGCVCVLLATQYLILPPPSFSCSLDRIHKMHQGSPDDVSHTHTYTQRDAQRRTHVNFIQYHTCLLYPPSHIFVVSSLHYRRITPSYYMSHLNSFSITHLSAREASWRRVFDPYAPLLFNLYRYLEQTLHL